MAHFTDQIASYIVENNLDLKHLTIVLPSERAKKYIAASLYKQVNKPLLAPEMVTIDRWIKGLSKHTVIDKTRALLRLYQIQLGNLTNPEDADFDEFLTWGNIVLSDYDELDRYLLSSVDVFKNLADIKEIENWSFGTDKDLSTGQKRFMEFWDRLPDYYKRLNEDLEKDGMCYMGKAYRYVTENIEVVFNKDKNRQFLFAGFNALSASEKAIIKQLHRMGRAHILLNADAFYLDNPNHEAGRFLRSFLAELNTTKLPFIGNDIATTEKHIQLIECAQHTGQVKAAATLLNGFTEEECNETLVLLADESLIAPLLKNLPKKIARANITLGLPLRNTALRTWVELVFTIQENKTRFKSEAIYIHDLKRLWNHPFLTAILSKEEKGRIAKLEAKLIEKNSIFQNTTKLSIGELPDKVMQLLTLNWQRNWRVGVQYIRELNALLFRNLNENDAFEKAVIQGFDQALGDFENILIEGIPPMSIKSFKQLFHQHWNTKSIAYHGNPLEGLQIMGLLETRLLDFKKIIVLGMNEGKLPPTNPIQTMVPMDLRNYFNLPVPRDKQGLFAHHFYRLLHTCQEMWITYTSAQESIGSNEASRYILQLELELSRQNKDVKFSKSYYSIPNEISQTERRTTVEKSPEIMQRIDEIFAKPISASVLNKYLHCPLDFYYQKVLDFGEEETVEEEIESNTLGTFIHNVLEKLYVPFARHNKDKTLKESQPPAITSFDIDSMLKKFEYLIEQEFYDHFSQDKSAYATGKNLLSFKMAVELLERILKQERKFLSQQTEPVFIEYLEAELIADMEVEVAGKKKTIQLKGFVDRIDSIGGKIRIIDYKSGKVKGDDVQLNELKDETDLGPYFSKTKHALQLSMYMYLYEQNFGVLPYQAGIYSLINISDGIFPFEGKNKTNAELLEVFQSFMGQLITEIYDLDMPFTHKVSPFKSWCLYCE